MISYQRYIMVKYYFYNNCIFSTPEEKDVWLEKLLEVQEQRKEKILQPTTDVSGKKFNIGYMNPIMKDLESQPVCTDTDCFAEFSWRRGPHNCKACGEVKAQHYNNFS